VKLDPSALAVSVLALYVTDLAAAVLPAARYVYAGDLDLDRIVGEVLVVHGLRVYQGQPGAEAPARTNAASQWVLELGVTLARCQSQDEIARCPPASVRDTFGRLALADVGALLRVAVDAHEAHRLLPECGLIHIGPAAWSGPAGGMIATTLTLAATL
jgi:hypothetical protein